MKDIEEFVKKSVKIEYQKQANQWGYFPFHCFVEKQNGNFDVIVIAGIESVEDCYKIIAMCIQNNCKRVYMALDFPAGGDIDHDFVAVFATEGIKFDAFAIPYNIHTGEVYQRINHSQRMIEIVTQLRRVSLAFLFENPLSQN